MLAALHGTGRHTHIVFEPNDPHDNSALPV
jgi:hypothetical protein